MKAAGKSLLDCTEQDFLQSGYPPRYNLALGAISGSTQRCIDGEHEINLACEDGILYLTCNKCLSTRFLHEKDDPRTNPKAYQKSLDEALGITR